MAETRQPPVHRCLEAHGSEQAFRVNYCRLSLLRLRCEAAAAKARYSGETCRKHPPSQPFLPSALPLLYLMRSDRLHHCSASFMEMKVAAAPIGARRIFKNSVVRSWLQTYSFIFGNSCPLHSLHSNPPPTFVLQHLLYLLHHRCSGLKIRHLLVVIEVLLRLLLQLLLFSEVAAC